MPVYALIIWAVIGAVLGWLAPRIFRKAGPWGLAGDIVTGIVGAIVLAYALGMAVALTVGISFLIAAVGALLLLWIIRKVVKR